MAHQLLHHLGTVAALRQQRAVGVAESSERNPAGSVRCLPPMQILLRFSSSPTIRDGWLSERDQRLVDELQPMTAKLKGPELLRTIT